VCGIHLEVRTKSTEVVGGLMHRLEAGDLTRLKVRRTFAGMSSARGGSAAGTSCAGSTCGVRRTSSGSRALLHEGPPLLDDVHRAAPGGKGTSPHPGHGARVRQERPRHAPQAVIAIAPFHVAKAGSDALDEVRHGYLNELRDLGDADAARRFKGARWALLKRPDNLSDAQAATLGRLRAAGGEVWRAYTLKEALRAISPPGLTADDIEPLINRFISRARRSRLQPFVKLAANDPKAPRRDPRRRETRLPLRHRSATC
jgi:hypothetical protein